MGVIKLLLKKNKELQAEREKVALLRDEMCRIKDVWGLMYGGSIASKALKKLKELEGKE